jgi:hypothetical protein
MYIFPPDQQDLIFFGKQLKDTSKARGNACLSLPDQQRLTFAGKRLEDVLTTQGDVYLPPDQQHLVFHGKPLEDALKARENTCLLSLDHNASSPLLLPYQISYISIII